MSRAGTITVGLVAALVLGAPASASAQSDGWWDWALREVASFRSAERGVILDRDGKVGDRRDRGGEADRRTGTLEDIILGRRDRDDRYDDRYERNTRGKKGPKFCQNGQGHPVHGRAWCRDKGFGTDRYDRYDVRWEERGWEDIILGAPRDGDRRRRAVDQGGLIDILGDVVFRRMDSERRRAGTRSPLEGRWLDLRGGGSVLQIRAGSVPIAELTDVDGDGRVDAALVPRR